MKCQIFYTPKYKSHRNKRLFKFSGRYFWFDNFHCLFTYLSICFTLFKDAFNFQTVFSNDTPRLFTNRQDYCGVVPLYQFMLLTMYLWCTHSDAAWVCRRVYETDTLLKWPNSRKHAHSKVHCFIRSSYFLRRKIFDVEIASPFQHRSNIFIYFRSPVKFCFRNWYRVYFVRVRQIPIFDQWFRKGSTTVSAV